MTQHKWHKEIKAWADGSEIETCSAGIWSSTDYPAWHSKDHQFCIKQQPKEKQYLYVYQTGTLIHLGQAPHPALNIYETIILGKIEVQND